MARRRRSARPRRSWRRSARRPRRGAHAARPVAEGRTEAVFPGVARGRGHYESFYLRASHPSEALGVWIRHTVHKPPDGPAKGSVWFVLFEAGGPVASKMTVADVSVPEDGYIRIGDSTFAPGRAVGSAPADAASPSREL